MNKLLFAIGLLVVLAASAGASFKIMELNGELQEMRASLQEAKDSSAMLVVRNDSLSARLDSADASLRTVQASFHSTQAKLEGVQSHLVAVQSENRQLEHSLTTTATRNRTLEGSLANVVARNEALSNGLNTAHERNSELASELWQAEAQNKELADYQRRYEELSSADGAVEQLERRAQELREEIEELWQQRQYGYALTYRNQSSLQCTGSMEPTMTCLDLVTWDNDFAPEDITVGMVISYDPNCWDEEAVGIGTSHRVMDIKVEDGVHYYWPKGDGNAEPDGCWIPHTSVYGYVTAVQKNIYMENAELRDQVNAAKADYESAEDSYRDLLERYCGDRYPDTCYFGSHQSEVDEALARLTEAYDSYYNCWFKNAEDSEYPGHIPYAC